MFVFIHLIFFIIVLAFFFGGVHAARMKAKSSKSKIKRTAEASQPAATVAAGLEGKGEAASGAPQTPTPTVTVLEFPPPSYLFEKARGEPSNLVLGNYLDTIRMLRIEKGFTFREIAEWLTENGVEADYNAVYRVFTRGMSESQAALEDHLDSEADRREA